MIPGEICFMLHLLLWFNTFHFNVASSTVVKHFHNWTIYLVPLERCMVIVKNFTVLVLASHICILQHAGTCLLIMENSHSSMAGFVAAHTLPVLYERYDDQIDDFIYKVLGQLQHNYRKLDARVLSKVPTRRFTRKKSMQNSSEAILDVSYMSTYAGCLVCLADTNLSGSSSLVFITYIEVDDIHGRLF